MSKAFAMLDPVPHLFDAMDDPRTGNRLTYSLPEILLAALCAVLCGCRSCEQFATFTAARLEFLRRHLPYPHGTPSHDTFSRLFRLLPPAPFARLLAGLAAAPGCGGAVAIDGKVLRGSADAANAGSALMTLCAFATETGLALGQVAVDAKSNEIPAVAVLIRDMELNGVVVTLDALHCQRETAKRLNKAGARYALALKTNQPSLHDDVALFMADPATPTTVHIDVDGGHGRIETRIARVCTDVEWLQAEHDWPGLTALGAVERVRETRTGTVREQQLYLLGHAFSAAELAALSRGHWGIENRLHWVLDVSMGEDACRARRDHAAENLATLRRLALNAIRRLPGKRSVPLTMLDAMLETSKLSKLLNLALNS
jgi:predicted transposase YbfD/YdcC